MVCKKSESLGVLLGLWCPCESTREACLVEWDVSSLKIGKVTETNLTVPDWRRGLC